VWLSPASEGQDEKTRLSQRKMGQGGLDRRLILLYNSTMKVKELLKKLYEACVTHDKDSEKKFEKKLLKKSLKHKKTHIK